LRKREVVSADFETDDTAFIVVAQLSISKRRRYTMKVKSNIKAGITCRKAGGDQQEYL
jgi:hypothetical protein